MNRLKNQKALIKKQQKFVVETEARHNEEIKLQRDKLHSLEMELEEICEETGGHEDDGGFLYGICRRCGSVVGW